MSPNHVGHIERGGKIPGLDTVEAIARSLDSSPAEPLGEHVVGDAWLKHLVIVAHAVPPSRRGAFVTMMAAIAAALGRSDLGKELRPVDLKQMRDPVDELNANAGVVADDPRVMTIVSLLRGRSEEDLDQALRILKAKFKP